MADKLGTYPRITYGEKPYNASNGVMAIPVWNEVL